MKDLFQNRILTEINRALKNGGKLIVINFRFCVICVKERKDAYLHLCL